MPSLEAGGALGVPAACRNGLAAHCTSCGRGATSLEGLPTLELLRAWGRMQARILAELLRREQARERADASIDLVLGELLGVP